MPGRGDFATTDNSLLEQVAAIESGKVHMKRSVALAALLLVLVTPLAAWARGGGGCIEQGTPVLTPAGPIAIDKLQTGDSVWSVSAGRLLKATVRALSEVTAERYLEVIAGRMQLRVTEEHPFMVAPGVYRMAAELRAGDRVYLTWRGRLRSVQVDAIRSVPAAHPAYNLVVSPGGTFAANGVVVHNKGCFLPDTPVLKPDGSESPISTLRRGQEVLAYTPEGRMVRAKVRDVLRHKVDEYLVLKTDRTTLRVTREHPFYVGQGTFKTLEALKVDDTILAWDGESLSPQRILSMEIIREQTPVFNLQTDRPNTFLAGSLAVHNKGGGCFPAGTRVATPKGPVAIESLAHGDQILTVDEKGSPVQSPVEGIFVSKNTLWRIETDHGPLVATREHPVALWDGGFRWVGLLQPGDVIRHWEDGRFQKSTVQRPAVLTQESLVLNLRVGEPHTFLAEGVLVHNKGGGCFPAGTPIRTPTGDVPIETLAPGDDLLAVDPQGKVITTKAESIHRTQSLPFTVRTDRGPLRTTLDHPLALSNGDFVPADQLQSGNLILSWEHGVLRPATILGSAPEEWPQAVYNLSVTWPHTFMADGFVVHNKGGSSSSSRSSSSSSSGDDLPWWGFLLFMLFPIFFFIIIIAVFVSVFKNRKSKSENLDYVYSAAQVNRKAKKTEKLLQFVAAQDPTMAPKELKQLAESTFRKLQECWQAREYGPMEPLLMPALYAQHTAQLQGMIRNNETNHIEGLKVERIDLVNLRYTEKADQREFIALISASARDYYTDDRSGKFIRGDKSAARFQEFWTFQFFGNQWLVREIEQAGESESLKEENFVEMLTDENVQNLYAETAKEGTDAAWVGKEEAKKATRIDRLLNFLAQTDKLWTRRLMLERARQVFMTVYLTRESGDPQQIPGGDLFPEVAQSLKEQLQRLEADGSRVEYRNLCIRKAELIHVRNYAERERDEFTVRIDAHAQQVVRKGDQTVSEQQYVTPFEEFWTFGRRDDQWKLKEVVPAALAKKMVTTENVDEDSSAGQLEWYYRQTRAN